MSKNRERISVTLPPDLIEKVRALQPETIANISTSRKFEFILTKGLGAIK